MASRPKYNQYLTSNRRQVPAGIVSRRNISIGIPLDLSIPVTGEERGHEVYRNAG